MYKTTRYIKLPDINPDQATILVNGVFFLVNGRSGQVNSGIDLVIQLDCGNNSYFSLNSLIFTGGNVFILP